MRIINLASGDTFLTDITLSSVMNEIKTDYPDCNWETQLKYYYKKLDVIEKYGNADKVRLRVKRRMAQFWESAIILINKCWIN